MNEKDVKEARAELTRFSKKLKELEDKIKENPKCAYSIFFGCAETGAVKRASMDLSRVLVKLR